MKIKFTTLFITLLIFALFACKSTDPVQNIDINDQISPREIQEDIDFLYQSVTQINPIFYNNPDLSASFRNRLDSAILEVDKPLNRTDIFVRFSPAISALNDGHTNFSFPMADIYNYLNNGGLFFPFDVLFNEDKIYIFRSYSDDPSLSPGTEIRTINGLKAKQIISDLKEIQSGANPQWRLRRMEGQSDFLKALLWMKYGWGNTFELELLQNEEQIKKTVSGVPIDSIREQRNSNTNNQNQYEYRLIDNQTGLLTIRTFGGNFKQFRDFLSASFEQINNDSVTNLIIDVRDNTGGQSDHVEELLAYLVSEPFNLYSNVSVRASKSFKDHAKQRIPVFFRWLPIQYLNSTGRAIWRAEEGELVAIEEERVNPKRESKRFSGTSYLLINEGSFSNAAVFASTFKRLGLGLLVGRTTGGEDGTLYAESLHLHLPNSKLAVNISTMKFVLDEEKSGITLPGVEPDIYIPVSIDDKINEIDTIIEKAGYIIQRNNLQEPVSP